MPKRGVLTPTVKSEDRLQHQQYGIPGQPVRFHSLKDFDRCEHVSEFLDKMREKISTENQVVKNNNSNATTCLFLQNFPFEGKQI